MFSVAGHLFKLQRRRIVSSANDNGSIATAATSNISSGNNKFAHMPHTSMLPSISFPLSRTINDAFSLAHTQQQGIPFTIIRTFLKQITCEYRL